MTTYILLILALVGTFEVLALVPQLLARSGPNRWADRWHRRHDPLRPGPHRHASAHHDPERLLADLSRVSGVVRDARGTRQPGGYLRMQAGLLAYDDVLLECCRRLDPPVCGPRSGHRRRPLTDSERLDLEMALLDRGLTW